MWHIYQEKNPVEFTTFYHKIREETICFFFSAREINYLIEPGEFVLLLDQLADGQAGDEVGEALVVGEDAPHRVQVRLHADSGPDSPPILLLQLIDLDLEAAITTVVAGDGFEIRFRLRFLEAVFRRGRRSELDRLGCGFGEEGGYEGAREHGFGVGGAEEEVGMGWMLPGEGEGTGRAREKGR